MRADIHPINLTLMHLLENQMDRTRYALEGLGNYNYARDPGGDCHSIQLIGEHLIGLRRFQLTLLGFNPDRAKHMPEDASESAQELLSKLVVWAEILGVAIEAHDPDDWHAEPTKPREGPWADLPTLIRVIRPFNDYANHLGSIRAIRRIMGSPASQTQ